MLRQAWHDARDFAIRHVPTEAAVTIGGSISAIYFAWESGVMLIDAAIHGLIGGSITIAVMAVVYSPVAVTVAPYRVWGKQKSALKKQPAPALSFAEISYAYEETAAERMYSNDGEIPYGLQTCKVHIANIGNNHLDNCVVQITKLVNGEGREGLESLPISLIVEPPEYQNEPTRFDLRADQRKTVRVAILEVDNIDLIELQCQDANNKKRPRLSTETDWFLTLSAYGSTSEVNAEYRLFKDRKGKLNLEQLGEK